MDSYDFSLTGVGNVVKSGATQKAAPTRDDAAPSNPGGDGSTKVEGKNTPVIVKTGAENDGGDRS